MEQCFIANEVSLRVLRGNLINKIITISYKLRDIILY